jgi:nicotinamide mononucleotide transporter
MNLPEILEWIAALLSLVGVWLMSKRHRAGFPVNFAACLLYTWIFGLQRLYGNTGLQVWFALMQVYGWYYWNSRTSAEHTARIIPRLLSRRQLFITLTTLLSGTLILGYYLDNYTQADLPWPDAFCTSGSVIAQILLSRAYLLNWLLWIAVDLVYIPMYLAKQLYPTAVLYAVLLIIAAMAWHQWRKVLRA